MALVNLGEEPIRIAPGDRIAQLVVAPVVRVVWEPTKEASVPQELSTARGAGGFGHTGLSGKRSVNPGDGAND